MEHVENVWTSPRLDAAGQGGDAGAVRGEVGQKVGNLRRVVFNERRGGREGGEREERGRREGGEREEVRVSELVGWCWDGDVCF